MLCRRGLEPTSHALNSDVITTDELTAQVGKIALSLAQTNLQQKWAK